MLNRQSLAPLAERDFRWFFLARLTSMSGSSMAPVALAFAVLGVDQSASALGLVLGGRTATLVIFVLIGGVVADRMPRARLIQLSHGASFLTQGLAAALVISGHATIGRLLAIECLNGAVSAFALPSMQGLIPQLVSRDHLQQANALMSFSRNITNIGGPMLAGLLVAGPGAGWALAVDSATYLLAIFALAQIRLSEIQRAPTSMVADLKQGWGEVTSRTWLWVVVAAFALLNAIQAGAWGVLGPYIAKTDGRLGVTGWSLVLACWAAGSVLMTLVLLRRRIHAPLLTGMIGCSLLGLAIAALGVYPVFWIVAILALLAGLGSEQFSAGWELAMMENVPQESLSRVYSYDMLGSFIAIPVGSALFGVLATSIAPSRLLSVAGAAYLLIALGTLTVPSVRQLRRAPVR